jgi:uncharacterized membrane protein YcfT
MRIAHSVPDEDRVAWVDHGKGLCIVMVVMMHSTLGVEKAAGAVGWVHPAIEFAMPFRMPDFFLISGLFLARVIDRDWRTYLDRKAVHFAYFYGVWVLIQWATKSLGPAVLSGDWTGVTGSLVSALWDPPGTMWFVYVLPIFFIIAKSTRGLPPALVLGVAALLQMMPHEVSWYVGQETCERLVFFLVGYYAAPRIFAFAALVDRYPRAALLGLVPWALANGALVALGIAHVPGIGLVLGLAGALAVVSVAVLLSRQAWTAPLRYCGRNSLVVYLAFFLPMASLRAVLLGSGLIDDLGTISLLVSAASVVTPLLLHAAVKGTRLRFLFERPGFARIAPPREKTQAAEPARPLIVPAE